MRVDGHREHTLHPIRPELAVSFLNRAPMHIVELLRPKQTDPLLGLAAAGNATIQPETLVLRSKSDEHKRPWPGGMSAGLPGSLSKVASTNPGYLRARATATIRNIWHRFLSFRFD